MNANYERISEDKVCVGTALRLLRLKRGFTQPQVARKLKYNTSVVSNAESGIVKLHNSTILKIIDILGYTIEDYLLVEKQIDIALKGVGTN